MEDTLDPWDWDTQRIVQELCTEQRTWTPLSDPPKLPNLERLKESLEENEVDGQCFLGSASEESDFWSDLGIKSVRHKETLRSARNQFRRRSPRYKIWKIRQEQENDDGDDDSIARLEQDDHASRKRKLDDERKQDSAGSTYNPAEAVLSNPSTPTVLPQVHTYTVSTPAVPETTTGKPDEISVSSEEPVRKKRRIAPITISADVSIDSLRNIPQGTLVSELKPMADETSDEMLGAYLGADVLNRTDIVDFDFTGQPLTNEDLEFEFHQEPYPIGMRRQRARLVNRRLAKWRCAFRPTKEDVVPGGKDPEHYEVLPPYGESDDEYDSDTWKEIQAEEEERKKFKNKPCKELSMDEKNTMINQIIAEKVTAWHNDKLPLLEPKANRLWNKSRRQGFKHALDRENQLIDRYQARLDSYRDKIVKQQWSNEADMRKVEGILDQTIADFQYSTWVLNLMRSPSEPKRLPRAPRQRQARTHVGEKAVLSDEEILTSESESDNEELEIFIIDNELELRDEVMIEAEDDEFAAKAGASQDQVESSQKAANEKRDLGEVDGPVDVPIDSASSSINEMPKPAPGPDGEVAFQSAQQDVPLSEAHTAISPVIGNPVDDNHQIEDVSMEMGDTTIDEEEVFDLTQSEPPVKCEETSTPERLKVNRDILLQVPIDMPTVIDLVTPEKGKSIARFSQTPQSRLGWSSHLSLGLSSLQEAQYSENERLVLQMIKHLDEVHRSAIFGLSQWKFNDSWIGYVRPALLSMSLPRLPFESLADRDIFYGVHFARLFDVYLGNKSQHLRSWFGQSRVALVEKNQSDEFENFVKFLRVLATSFKVDSISREPTLPTAPDVRASSVQTMLHGSNSDLDGDLDDFDSNDDSGPPDKKRKPPVIKRDEAAMSIRESDLQRVEEQAERRKALRTKLALLEDTTASQNMRFIINESKEDEEGFIYVPRHIAGYIKDHQIDGVRFMWNQVVMNAKDRQGCLLAHTMGLGKTMQIITLLTTIADAALSDDSTISSQIPQDLKQSKTLVLAPAGLVNNWEDEFLMWTDGASRRLGEIWKVDSTQKDDLKFDILEEWSTKGGVLLIGYDLFRSLTTKSSDTRTKFLESPNIVVADEAHQLKSHKSKIHQITAEFRTHIRVALTGSPLANNVIEYYSMINWIAPNYLGDSSEFRQVFANPIESGISADSSRYERRKALVKLRSLKETIAPKVHRRTIHALKDELPQKTEFVISIPLTEIQRKAYDLYMGYHVTGNETLRLFGTLNVLGLLCNHPACFRERLMKQKAGQKSGDETPDSALPPQFVSEALTLIRHSEITGVKGEEYSMKVPLFNSILDESYRQGDKVLVFSHSIPTLNYLESVLRRRRRNYTRLDGSTRIDKRQDMVKDFNRKSYDVFLLSTTAGGYGLNIIGANRVIIFDFKFNPQHEQQAVGRAYRLGQNKPVFVYRFICGGTFEDKMHNKGVFKMQLASRVVDKKNPIPRGLRLEEFFALPVDPPQEDLSLFSGKDKVLDAVLGSDVGKSIRSIVMADTFEEENIEDEQLTHEEVQEAQQLIDRQKARLTGKEFIMLPLPGTPGTGRRMSPLAAVPYVETRVAANGLGARDVLTTSYTGNLSPVTVAALRAVINGAVARGTPGASTASVALDSTTLPARPAEDLGAASYPSFQPGIVEPIRGPTTFVRDHTEHEDVNMSAADLQIWSMANILKQELGRLFEKEVDNPAPKNERRLLAEQINRAFNEQATHRDRHISAQAKRALVEAVTAQSPFFNDAILTGKFTPAFLASLTAGGIRDLVNQGAEEAALATDTARLQLNRPNGDQAGQAVQDPATGGRSHVSKGTPVFQHQALFGDSTTFPAPAQRKSHIDNDLAVMQELRVQREGMKGEPKPLPNWARDAVANEGRSAPSPSASPTPTAPIRRAKNPFQEA